MSGGSAVISGNNATYGGGLYAAGGTVNNLTIKDHTLGADSKGGGIYIEADKELNLTGLTVTDNEAADGGGVYIGEGSVSAGLWSMTVSNNSATNNGGGIYVAGTLGFSSSTGFTGNTAGENGSGIYVTGTLTISGSATFSGYSAKNGGAIYGAAGSSITVSGGTFNDNTATQNGGGAIYTAGTLMISGGSFYDNNAVNGGAVFGAAGSEITITGGSFYSNKATANGGAVYTTGKLTAGGYYTSFGVNGDSSKANTAGENGAAIYVATGDGISMTNASYYNHTNTSGDGGAVYVLATGGTNTVGGSFYNSSAVTGGAIYVATGGDATVSITGTYNNNTATGDGGAIYAKGNVSVGYISAGTNTAGGNGGAVYLAVTGGANTVDGRYSGNSAVTGGAVYVEASGDAAVSITGYYHNNNVTGNGGAVYAKGNVSASISADTNTAGGDGGAVYLEVTGGAVYLEVTGGANTVDGRYSGNTAVNGGAVYLKTTGDAAVTVSGNYTVNNATDDGGAVYATGNVSVEGTYGTRGDIDNGNTAGGNGGAVYLKATGADSTMDALYYYNKATGDGGAVYLAADSTVSGTASFYGNTATGNGGAMYLGENSSLTATGRFYFGGNDETVEADAIGNTAKLGGAIYSYYASFIVPSGDFDVDFIGNQAEEGGAIYAVGGTVSLLGGTDEGGHGGAVKFNKATAGHGGAFYFDNVVSSVERTTFTNNSATGNGGAMYLTGENGTFTSYKDGWHRNSATYGGAVYIDAGTFTITRSGTFGWGDESSSGGNTAVKGGAIYMAGGEANISNSSMQYNSASEGGGAAYVENGSLTMALTGINNNTAVNGGGIYAEGGTVAVNSTTLEINTAGADGGAIYMNGGEITLSNTTVQTNTAVNGGGIYAEGGKLTLGADSNSPATLLSNTATGDGGGMYLTGTAEAAVTAMAFAGNTATKGGAVYNDIAELNVSAGNFGAHWDTKTGAWIYLANSATYGGTFYNAAGSTLNITGGNFFGSAWSSGQDAAQDGGLLYNEASAVAVIGPYMVFEGYNAGNNGGAIYSAGSLTLNGSTFQNNTAVNDGGAVYLADGAFSQEAPTTFDNNEANNGGAVYGRIDFAISGYFTGNIARAGDGGAVYGEKSVTVSDSKFNGNSATGNGGAVYAAGDAVVSHSEFRQNTAMVNGGAVYAAGNTANMDNTLLANNMATGDGGAVYFANAAVAATLTNLTIANNTAANGGGIYTAGNNVTVQNSILWGNKKSGGAAEQYVGLNTALVSYSGIQGWTTGGAGNVSLQSANNGANGSAVNDNALNEYYVCFVDEKNGDYTLDAGSYLINRGSNEFVADGETDLTGGDRIYSEANGGRADMGAYESILKGNVVVSADGANIVYGDTKSLTSSQDGYGGNDFTFSGDSNYLTFNGNDATAVKANGDVTVTVKYEGDDNWNDRSTTVQVTTVKRGLVIKADDKTHTYDGTDHNLRWNNDTRDFVLDDYLDDWLNTAYRNAGTYTGEQVISNALIMSDTRGDVTSNYEITYEGEMKIGTATLTITGGTGGHTYDGTDHDYIYTVSGLGEGDKIDSIINGTNSYRNAGTYTNLQSGAIVINGDGENMKDNYTIIYKEGTVVVNKATLIITGQSDNEHTYNGQYQEYGYTQEGLVDGDSINTINNGTLSVRNAGTYTNLQSGAIVLNGDGENMKNNYEIEYVLGTVTINKATLTITGQSDDERTYDGKYHDYTYTQEGLVDGDSIDTINNGTLSVRNAGTYTNLQSGAVIMNGDSEVMNGNYEIEYLLGTVTINKAELVIVIDSYTKDQGRDDPTFTGTATGLIGNDTVTGYGRTDKGENPGQYTIDQFQINDDNNGGNYEVTVYNGTLTIREPAPINIYSDASSRNYVINGMDQASLMNTISALSANRDIDAVLDTDTDGNLSSASHQTTLKAENKFRNNLREDSQKKSFEEIDQENVRSKSSLLAQAVLSSGEKTSIVESEFQSDEKSGRISVQVPASGFSAGQNTSFESDHPMHTMPPIINIDGSGVNDVGFSGADLANVIWIEKIENFKDDLDILLEEMMIV